MGRYTGATVRFLTDALGRTQNASLRQEIMDELHEHALAEFPTQRQTLNALKNLPAPERPSGSARDRGNVLREDEIRDGMVFKSTGANQTLRGAREIVVCSVYPGKMQATVNDLRTGKGWRTSLFTLANPSRWQYTGVKAWETATS